MQLLDASGLHPSFVVTQRRPHEYRLTLLLKGTFDIVPGGVVTPAAKQLMPMGDIPFEDDEEGVGPPRYASDLVPFKPKAEYLVAGACYPPGGPAGECKVSVRVGDLRKSLVVSGIRAWRKGAFGQKPTDPAPFDRQELRYEYAYGGEGWKNNPAGMGRDERTTPGGKVYIPVPHIEAPRKRIKTPRSKPDPAGLGPIPLLWPQRISKAGNYKGDWATERWPNYAKDMDWTIFNAAPEDQHFEGYLESNENVVLTHLHPDHPKLKFTLPSLRARAFRHSVVDIQGQSAFTEIPMRCDTLFIDAEALQAVLVWRGVTQVTTPECEEVERLYFATEPLADPVRSEGEHRRDMESRLQSPVVEPEPQTADDLAVDVEAELAKAEAVMAEGFEGTDFDRENLPPQDEESRQMEEAILAEHGHHIPPPALTRQDVVERRGSGGSLVGAALDGLDLTGIDFAGADLSGAGLRAANLGGCDLTGANLSESVLERAILEKAVLTGADLSRADAAGADLGGSDLSGAILEEAVFDKANLIKANLVKATGEKVSFAGADLSDALLGEAEFPEADFTGATLSRADLRKANLTGAAFEKVTGEGIDATEAILNGLRASESMLSGFRASRAQAKESNWVRTELAEADFRFADLDGSDMARADLGEANLSAVTFKAGSFTRARMVKAKVLKSNLHEATFEGADLTGADFRGSNLYSAEFLEATLAGARFELALVSKSKLDS